MEPGEQDIAATKRTWWILWGSLGVAQIVYLYVPTRVTRPVGVDSVVPAPIFPVVLGVVAVGEALGLWLLFQIRAVRPIREGRLDPDSAAGLAQLFQTLLLAWILAESIAIYGLVLHLMQHPWLAWAPFAALGAIMLVLCRPGQASLQPPVSSVELASRGEPIE